MSEQMRQTGLAPAASSAANGGIACVVVGCNIWRDRLERDDGADSSSEEGEELRLRLRVPLTSGFCASFGP